MESQRSFLVIGLALVSFLLWQQWQLDYGPQPVQQVTQPESQSSVPSNTVPSSAVAISANKDVPQSDAPAVNTVQTANTQLINIETDVLLVKISPLGGDIVSVALKDYPVEMNSSEAFQLLSDQSDTLYVAQSGLVGANGPDGNPQGRPLYLADKTQYTLTGDTLVVPLSWRSEDGMLVRKAFTFSKGSHQIDLNYQIQNASNQIKQVQQYAQLKQLVRAPEGGMFMPTYRGAAYGTEEDIYNKYEFDDTQDQNLRLTTNSGWVAMLQHYFVSAWVAPKNQKNTIYSRDINGNQAIIGFTANSIDIQPGQSTDISTHFYAGSKDQDTLKVLADGLDLTVDYGVLWWISQPLFSLLQYIHSLVSNWGLAIIFITIIVKGAMYPLTKKQYESMAKMRALQPKMQALKERHGDDRQKMSQGMMELYKKEKVNPMGGCFPLLLQMPIFLALYWVLLESVELRHAEFFLWINDLSVMDPYFVLPVLTGASMYLLQRLQPMTMQDPMQQKIMQWMPVMMSVFFLWFPAGLVLYWLVSNVITIVQAKIIYASMEKRGIKTS